jgi:hypothetical protein
MAWLKTAKGNILNADFIRTVAVQQETTDRPDGARHFLVVAYTTDAPVVLSSWPTEDEACDVLDQIGDALEGISPERFRPRKASPSAQTLRLSAPLPPERRDDDKDASEV